MNDPVAALSSFTAVLAAIEKGVALAKQAKDQESLAILLEAHEQILDLKEDVISLRARHQELEAEVARLKQEGKIDVRLEANMYWQYDEDGKHGPMCPRCWEVDRELAEVVLFEDDMGMCSDCKAGYRLWGDRDQSTR